MVPIVLWFPETRFECSDLGDGETDQMEFSVPFVPLRLGQNSLIRYRLLPLLLPHSFSCMQTYTAQGHRFRVP